MGLREDSCQQLLTVWRKNGLYAVKLCGHFFCVMARMAQRALGARGFPGGGALRLLRATKSQSAVAPVSGSATGGSSVVNKLKAGRTNRRPGKAQPPPGIYACRRYFSAPVLLFCSVSFN